MCKCHLFFSPSACLFSAEGGEGKSYGGRTAKGYPYSGYGFMLWKRRKEGVEMLLDHCTAESYFYFRRYGEDSFRIWGA